MGKDIVVCGGHLARDLGVATLVGLDQTVTADSVADGQNNHQQPDDERRFRKTTGRGV